MSEISLPNPVSPRRFYKRGEFWGIAGALVAGAVFGTAEIAINNDENANAARDVRFGNEIIQQLPGDGFSLAGPVYIASVGKTGGRAEAGIQVEPGCALDEVEMTYTSNGPNGDVSDVTSYSVRAVLNGTISQRYNAARHRMETQVDGTPVTFTFTNRQDLEQNILGTTLPCAALAQNVGIVASAGN